MDRNSMVARIATFADTIKKLNSKGALELPTNEFENDELSFVYETVCYFYLLSNLRGVTEIRYRPGRRGNVLANTTGNKLNHLYYYVRLADGKFYDICLNTAINDRYNDNSPKRHPDISIQIHDEAEFPKYDKIIAIWDAKHRSVHEDAPISREEFEKFVGDMDVLGIKKPVPDDLVDRTCPNAFLVCGLITNGEMPRESMGRFLEKGFSCTKHFVGKPGQLPSPARQQHYSGHMQPTRTPASSTSPPAATTGAALFSAENPDSPSSATNGAPS